MIFSSLTLLPLGRRMSVTVLGCWKSKTFDVKKGRKLSSLTVNAKYLSNHLGTEKIIFRKHHDKLCLHHQVNLMSMWSYKTNYLKSDKIPPNYTLVYKGPLKYYLIMLHFGLVFAVTFMTYSVILGYLNRDEPFEENEIVESPTQLRIWWAAFVLLLLGWQVILRRFVLRIYYNSTKKDFIAVFYHWLPLTTRKLNFKCGEVKAVTTNSELRTSILSDGHKVKNQRLIMYGSGFKLPHHYNLMLGYAVDDD